MTAITALNVRLGMDASMFAEGAELARAEVNKVSSILRQSEAPASKFKKEMELLDRAFSATGKQSKAYADAVEHLRKKHGQISPAINKTTTDLNSLKQSMLSAVPGGGMLTKALTGPAGAALALAAAAAIAWREMMRMATQIDETAKAAKSLGVSYRDLVAIQMLASESAGLDASSVNRGLSMFTKNLAEARVNGGRLKESLSAIGLDVNALAAMDPAEAFRQVADAIANVPDKTEQVRLATLLAGKEGIKLVEVFRQGGAAVDAMAKEAERLGAVLSEEAVAEVESMNDAFGRVKMGVDGIWSQSLAEIAPLLTEIATLASDFLALVIKTGKEFGMFGPMLNQSMPVLMAMVNGLRLIIAQANDLISIIASIPKLLGGGELNLQFEETKRLIDDLDAKMNGVAEKTATATDQAEALAIETERAAEEARKIEEAFEKRVKNLEIERIALEGNTDLAERMRLAAEGFNEEQIDTIRKLQEENELVRQRIEAERKAQEEAKKAADDQLRQREKEVKEAEKLREQMEKAFDQELSSSLKAAKDFFENERRKDEERRKAVAAGPSSMEAGSAEAAKFMADQVNRAIGAAAVPEKPTPGEQEIAMKAAELLTAQREANAKQQEELESLKTLIVAVNANRFSRIR